MKNKSSTFIAGVLAIGIYIFFVLFLLFYFSYSKDKKPLHFVKKNEKSIRISLASMPLPKVKKQIIKKSITKPVQKKHIRKKVIKKKITQKKVIKKKVIKKKVVKKKLIKKKVIKKVEKKVLKSKKNTKAKDLFANIKTSKSPDKKLSQSLKLQKKKDQGIKNAYFARIEERLKDWPAQAEYVGEKAKVWIKVESSGKFKFKVISASGNRDFNIGLIAYLKQLQMFGFGRHEGKRAYEINVEFEATN